MTDTCTTCGHPVDPHPYRHPITRVSRVARTTPQHLDDSTLRSILEDGDATELTAVSMAEELLAGRARITELEGERDQARAQFGLLFDAMAARGASFTTEQGRVVAVEMPSPDELHARIVELEAEAQADERAIEEARDERDAARDRAAELEAAPVRELIGYAVASTAGQDDYLCLASDLLHQSAATANGELIMARAASPSTPWRVVELREVTEP